MKIYKPRVGMRNHQFTDVPDICDLRSVAERAKKKRVREVEEYASHISEKRPE